MPTDPLSSPDPQRIQAEALWEELDGDLCICQRADVSHWCEVCQRRIDVIMNAFTRQRAAERQQATAQQADHSRCHDLVCNGDRSQPRGSVGSSCSCKGRDTAYAEVASLTQQRDEAELAEARSTSDQEHAERIRADAAEAQVTAQAAEIARLTDERDRWYETWVPVEDFAHERERAEAAEQQIPALHQQIAKIRESGRQVLMTTDENITAERLGVLLDEIEAVAAHPTGGPA